MVTKWRQKGGIRGIQQDGTNPQLFEIQRKMMEPASGLEPPTCGLRISDSPTSDNLPTRNHKPGCSRNRS